MNRELARTLKAAGFPVAAYRIGHRFYPLETSSGWTDFAREHGVTITRHELEDRLADIKDGYYCPNIADLIEACGERFGQLYILMNTWFAQSDDAKIVAVGDNPEEALANLWLMLNGKA